MKHRKYKKLSGRIAGLAASAALLTGGFVMSSAQEAKAAYARYHPSSCQVMTGGGSWLWGSNTGGRFSVYDDITVLGCPIPDSSELSKRDIQGIEAYYYDGTSAGNNYTRVSVCATDRDSLAAGCAAAEDAGGAGAKTLVLSSAGELAWIQSTNRDDYYAMLQVYIRSDTNTSSNSQQFLGYTVHDT